MLRIGAIEYPVDSAELTYTCVPDGTIVVDLDVRGGESGKHRSPHLTLHPPALRGRALADLAGQVQVIESPTRPARFAHFPNAVESVAGIYIYSHEDVHDSRIEWGPVAEGALELRWTGMVDDEYGAPPRRPLLVEVRARTVERPHQRVRWLVTRAAKSAPAQLLAVKPALLARVAAELDERRWFDGQPFASIELVVQVDEAGQKWPALPTARAGEPPFVLVRIPRPVAECDDAEAITQAIRAQVAFGLDALDTKYRQGTPRFLR